MSPVLLPCSALSPGARSARQKPGVGRTDLPSCHLGLFVGGAVTARSQTRVLISAPNSLVPFKNSLLKKKESLSLRGAFGSSYVT